MIMIVIVIMLCFMNFSQNVQGHRKLGGFGMYWCEMVQEREKRAIPAPLHRADCDILPSLNISQPNLLYYASWANFYTVYDLRELKPDQTRFYLPCYAWGRYRQFSDNLVDAMFLHIKLLGNESRSLARQLLADVREKHRRETSKIGRLLSLYADGSVPDPTTFGEVRRHAWKIMPREALKTTAQRMRVKPVSKLALRWQAVDGSTELAQDGVQQKADAFTATTGRIPAGYITGTTAPVSAGAQHPAFPEPD